MLTINSLEEMKPYYNAKINTYEFFGKDVTIDICFTFSIDIKADIKAANIKAENINAQNINAQNINAQNINVGDINACNIVSENIIARDIFSWDINAENIIARDIDAVDIDARNISAVNIDAWDIIAENISFYEICRAHHTLKCKSIEGRRENAKYFCLNNEVEFINRYKNRKKRWKMNMKKLYLKVQQTIKNK